MTDKKEIIEKLQNLLKEEVNIGNLDLQTFFDDMEALGKQVNNKSVKKPNFFYGDISVTNYLLWLMLGELKLLNGKL